MNDNYEELNEFVGDALTPALAAIEQLAVGVTAKDCPNLILSALATQKAISQAAQIKKLAGQINVTIHALGILRCLPFILEDGEVIEYVSLGAGNTGRKFDLETNKRIAEFKFINWKGGAESIRQNSIFKDFFELSIAKTGKQKILYLLGTEQGLKFFVGGRSLNSVLSKNEATRFKFRELYGNAYGTVREYYEAHSDSVEILDVSKWLPELVSL
jgi:hypothetical protein